MDCGLWIEGEGSCIFPVLELAIVSLDQMVLMLLGYRESRWNVEVVQSTGMARLNVRVIPKRAAAKGTGNTGQRSGRAVRNES